MYRKVTSFILIVSLFFGLVPFKVYATDETRTYEDKSINHDMSDVSDIINGTAAITEGSGRTLNQVISQHKFTGNRGYAFAAEQGNNFIDRIKGKNAVVVGDNNVLNGEDRIIINREGPDIYIQDKYWSTGKQCIDDCFDNGVFRYIDPDGGIMQIEVPKDQYDDAVDRMAQKIKEGLIPGVTDPDDASKYVRKGALTYESAKNLAKAGTVESLTYDAATGVVAAGCTFGISTLLNYSVLRLNGVEREKAIKTSAMEGLKSGAGAFCVAVIAGQLAKTGAINTFKPSSEALTKALGEEFSKKLLKAFGQKVIAEEAGKSTAESATKQAARLLRTEALIAVVTIIVFSVPDTIDMFRGRISKKQFVKNFAVTAVSVVAGAIGYGLGGALSQLVVPGVGTVPGSIVGAIVLGTGAGFAADKISDYVTDDDADEMYEILQDRFVQNCEDYLINEEEANNILDRLSDNLNEDAFKDMYQSKDRESYADALLEPLFEGEVAKRETIELPSEEEMRRALKEELQGVVFIH